MQIFISHQIEGAASAPVAVLEAFSAGKALGN